ncbi:MAG TPA: ABC transporter permease [bacterium]|jgi:ABC-type dipeptide/oligopeptide/nickel transport system permease component|nr:ABC transporter permease [bacterium]
MHRFIARRFLQLVPVLLGLTLITFVLTYVVPGDPVDLIAKQEHLTPEARASLRHQLGTDVPLPVQYVRYLWRLLQGDLGRSYVTNQRVIDGIARAFPLTLRLGLAAFLLSTLVGVGAGILAGSRPHSWMDRLMTLITLAGISLPVIWVAPVAILLFAVTFRIFPPSGYDGWYSLVLPTLVLGVRAAFNTRITRASLLEVIGQDYIRTARAKGLAERLVITRHALRNALIPIVTVLGLDLASYLEGAFFVEFIFALPGMGRLALDAVAQRDLFMIQGTVLVAAVLYVIANLSVDVSYAYLDPRIRYG